MAVVLACLIVLSLIPGLKHFAKPAIESIWKMLHASGLGAGAWTVFLVKTIWRSHIDILRHLLLPIKDIDPTHDIRESQE